MKVLVTGANGHLGANLVAALLAAGHTVRGSVRALADPARTAHLKALGPVELVQADLEEPTTLRAAMDGMDAVLHSAAVYELYAPGREAAILRASIEGMDAALRAAKDARVAKMIVTSSVVALPLTAPGAPPSDETMWATDLRVPYIRAKTLGEQRAWALDRELGLELATILPGAFAGPGFQRPTPSVDLVAAIMKGAMDIAAPALNYPYVDVRDVARAHVMALEQNARGRFIACNDTQPTMTGIARTMHAIDASIGQPMFTLPGFLMPVMPVLDGLNARMTGSPRTLTPDLAGTLSGRIWNLTNAKIRRELGWSPQITLEQSLADTIAALRAA